MRIKLRSTIKHCGWSNITQIKSNMAGGCHLQNSIWWHNSAWAGSIWMKFGRLMQNDMLMMTHRSKSKQKVRL